MTDGFLALPPRSAKPRERGLTSVIDRGLTLADVDGLLDAAGHAVDLVKLGWGTAIVTANLPEKLARYRAHGVPVVLGGTLTELAVAQGRVDGLLAWLQELGIGHVEVSDGAIPMAHEEKLALIDALAEELVVLAEVGSKDPTRDPSPATWAEHMRLELGAGAWKVVAEARETGTAGIYGPDGLPRAGLIETIAAAVDPADVLFEAPKRAQQVWMQRRFGREVNLANVAPCNVLALETLRLGLRADTVGLDAPASAG